MRAIFPYDLTGIKFGKLTVIRKAEDYIDRKGNNHAQWECLCDCQLNLPEEQRSTKLIRRSALVSGYTKSCGCWNKEINTKLHKSFNIYDLSGNYGVGWTAKGEEFYFDLEDYDLIKDFTWNISDKGYVVSSTLQRKENKFIIMHDLIMGGVNPRKELVDHIHGKNSRNDNRKSNLRIGNKSNNAMNVPKNSRNTSGYVGVGLNPSKKSWYAKITVNGKVIRLGSYKNIQDAARARKEAEEKYFGEWSYDKSQKTAQ